MTPHLRGRAPGQMSNSVKRGKFKDLLHVRVSIECDGAEITAASSSAAQDSTAHNSIAYQQTIYKFILVFNVIEETIEATELLGTLNYMFSNRLRARNHTGKHSPLPFEPHTFTCS